MMNKKGFNLQELVFGIVVLIIIGLVATIKLVNIPSKALDNQEAALRRALKNALIVYNTTYERWYGSNCDDQYGDPDNCEFPFKLLTNPPAYAAGFGGSGTGKTWYLSNNGTDIWYIWCPHCEGMVCFNNKGSWYAYYYAGSNAGKIIKIDDNGH
ncbi:MAG: type II secretion system protein [Candidatus Omnitrophota bacterium]